MSNDNDSKYIVLNNSTYQLEAYLVNANDKGSAFPIRKGNINYLEVEDSLAFPGLRGTINLSNFYGIIQKYDLFDIINDLNVLVIDITNKDAAAISGGLPIKLAFEGIVGEAVESSKNIVDKSIIMSFEEFNVGYLRYRYMSNTDLGGNNNSSCSDYIKQVILKGLNKTKVEEVFKVSESGDIDNTITPAPASSIIRETASCYEILRFLMKNCYFEGGIPSLLTINSFYENKKYVRKFRLTNLGTFMSDFFTEVSKGENSADLSKYVLETFISGDSRSSTTFGSNFFDKYEIIRPDFKTVLSKKWVSHSVSSQMATLDGQTTNGFYTYEDAKDLFEQKVLGGVYAANLPTRSITSSVETVKQESGDVVAPASPNPVVTAIPDIAEWSDSILSTTLKSFIYDNTAITFTVPGGLHREAGYFIKIKVERNEQEKLKTQDISGYYFVISITHIFAGENYQNRIVAVKVNKNQKPVKSSNNALLNNLLTPKTTTTTDVTTTAPETTTSTESVINTSNTASSTTTDNTYIFNKKLDTSIDPVEFLQSIDPTVDPATLEQ